METKEQIEKQCKEITAIDTAVDNLTKLFIKRHCDIKTSDYYWIGDDYTGVASINDDFYNLTRIYEAIKYNATSAQLFDYQEQELKLAMKNKPMKINFVNYLKLK